MQVADPVCQTEVKKIRPDEFPIKHDGISIITCLHHGQFDCLTKTWKHIDRQALLAVDKSSSSSDIHGQRS